MTHRFHATLTDYYCRIMGCTPEDAAEIAGVITATLARRKNACSYSQAPFVINLSPIAKRPNCGQQSDVSHDSPYAGRKSLT